MKDLVLISQILILLLNVVTFIYLMDKMVNYKAVRVLILITFTVGLIVTFGQATWFAVLFSFTPALSLINKKDANRDNKKFGADFGRDNEPLQNIQRGSDPVF